MEIFTRDKSANAFNQDFSANCCPSLPPYCVLDASGASLCISRWFLFVTSQACWLKSSWMSHTLNLGSKGICPKRNPGKTVWLFMAYIGKLIFVSWFQAPPDSRKGNKTYEQVSIVYAWETIFSAIFQKTSVTDFVFLNLFLIIIEVMLIIINVITFFWNIWKYLHILIYLDINYI